MTDPREILKEVQDDLAITQQIVEELVAENKRIPGLQFEIGQLRERLRLSEEVNYSDDLADARRDRERDQEFERSADFQARGER